MDFERADAALSAVEGLNQEGKIQAQMAKVSAVVRFVVFKIFSLVWIKGGVASVKRGF